MFESIAYILQNNSDLSDVGSPQLDAAILAAECELRVQFPLSYRDYLQMWGWVSFGSHEYTGLGTSTNDVVTTTNRARMRASLPPHLVVVCDHDGDEYVCIDTSAMFNKECPVVIWDAPTKAVSRTRSNNFASFLASDMEEFLE